MVTKDDREKLSSFSLRILGRKEVKMRINDFHNILKLVKRK